MSIEHRNILTAFQPAKEISDPKRFAGRRTELEAGAELLAGKDHIFIYGPRGIGKSSLAKQLELIAKGNSELLEEIDSPLKDMKFAFATCFLTRDASVTNINQLLYRLMIDHEGFEKFSDLFHKFGGVPTYNTSQQLDAKLVADFWRRAVAISESAEDGLLIFVDEFELIQHHDGFSSLLKAAPKGVIFAITGIATTERELVRDHKSIDRQLDTGKLPVKAMEPADLLRVVATAEQLIKNEILYSEEAKTELIRLVAGQPYLLHLIGRESLLQAFRAKKKTISNQDLHDALTEIAAKKTDSELENQYLKSIGNSAQREIVLRAFARACRPNTHTSLAYPFAESQGVTNVSYYVTDLQKVNFGEPLRKVNEKVYSFRDPLFQAYVAATPCRLSQEKNLAAETGFSPIGQSFEILHISDTHYGQAHFFSNLPSARDVLPSDDRPSLEKFIVKAILKEDLKPNLLVISGDLTQRGTTSEFDLAKNSISSILDCLKDAGVATELIVTPGNHDVNWALQQGDSDPSMAFVPYVNFRNSLMTRGRIDLPIKPERLYEVSAHQFGNVKVIVATFNSAVLISKDDQRGYIGDSQLDNAFLEVNALDPEIQAVRLAIFHHHLVPVHSVESEVASELLLTDASKVKKRLLKERCFIAMHGHRHQGHEEIVGDGESSLVVIGCGSSAVVVPERGSQPLQFNRISVQLLKGTVGIQIKRYLFDVTHAEWTPQATKTFSIQRS